MLTNRGYVEAVISGGYVHREESWEGIPFMEWKGELVLTQDEGTIRVTLKYGREEATCSFPKRELSVLQALLDEGGKFLFQPKTGSGTLEIHRGPGNDMTVGFPEKGVHINPLQKDFMRAIQLVAQPLSDLRKMYPEISQVADEITSHNTEVVWALVFRAWETDLRHFARYRGSLTEGQVKELRCVAGVPSEVGPIANGDWVEFSREGKPKSYRLLDVDTYTFRPDYWEIRTVYGSSSGRYSAKDCFCNGRRLSSHELDLKGSRTKSKTGDVFVFVSRSGTVAGAEMTFVEMPLVEVYRAPERVGPFVHPDMIGKTPLQVSKGRKSRKFLGLSRGDKIVCPRCGELNCDDCQLIWNDEIWVARAGEEEEFLFAFQAHNLIGSDGTAQLKQWAPLVIKQHITAMDWPPEILSLELDGKDITAATCGVKIEKGSQMKVVLRR